MAQRESGDGGGRLKWIRSYGFGIDSSRILFGFAFYLG